MKKIEDYRVIRVNGDDNTSWIIVDAEGVVEKGCLHDTYDNNGNQMFPDECDFTFGESTFNDEFIEYLKNVIDFKIENECYFSIYGSEGNLVIAYTGIEDDEEEWLEEHSEEINEIAEKYRAEHEKIYAASYYNYHDGSNWQTLLFSSDNGYESEDCTLLDANDATALDILNEFINGDHHNGGEYELSPMLYYFDSGKYHFSQNYQHQVGLYEVTEVDE